MSTLILAVACFAGAFIITYAAGYPDRREADREFRWRVMASLITYPEMMAKLPPDVRDYWQHEIDKRISPLD